jgi:hypothetical protein
MRLAAAMSVFVAPVEGKPLEKIVGPNGGKPVAYFYFPSGTLASDLMKAWDAPKDGELGPCSNDFPGDHPLRNVEHPFWYVRAALRHRERYLDATMSARTLNIVRRGGRIYLVTV